MLLLLLSHFSHVWLFYDPMECSPPGSSVHGISPERILEWVAMPSSRGSSQPRDWTHISCVSFIAGGFFTTGPLGKPLLGYSWLTNNVVIVSSEEWKDSVIQTHASISPKPPLPSRLLQNTEQSSMCCAVGPYWLSILNIALCACLFQTSWLSLPSIHPPWFIL